MATVQVKFGERLLRLRPQSMTTNNLAMIFKLDINRGIYLNSEEEGEIILPSIGIENNGLFEIACVAGPTSFPGLSYEDEARHEKALVWAGHVTTQKMAVFDSYSSRSGEIFFNEIYKHKSSKQISKQPKDFSIDIILYLCVERSLARIS